MCCDMTHSRWTSIAMSEHSVTKCDCSVQKIRTNINNCTASKHVTICCKIFCIFWETST